MTRPLMLAITALLLAVVALLDYSIVEITFVELTYLVPLAFATWFGGRWIGLSAAVVAATCTTGIIVVADGVSGAFPIALDAIGCLGMFVAFVWLLANLRMHIERERNRLRGAIEQLRHAERLNVLGTLAAGVAHELGTPLNVISGAAEMLDEDDPSRAKTRELSRVILAQTEKITVIIRRLLEFGRRGHGGKPIVPLDRSVVAAVELLEAIARKRGSTIELAVGEGERNVRANPQEIEQVVSNLILNGIQAMPHGGRVTVGTHCDDRAHGTIVVQDEGSGILAADLPHIFDPFFTTKDVGEGTGLGLSVSYGIVSDLGGTIDVATQVGRGTRFTVKIPLA